MGWGSSWGTGWGGAGAGAPASTIPATILGTGPVKVKVADDVHGPRTVR